MTLVSGADHSKKIYSPQRFYHSEPFKVTLFVVGLLTALGALVAHYMALGFAPTLALGITGGVLMVAGFALFFVDGKLEVKSEVNSQKAEVEENAKRKLQNAKLKRDSKPAASPEPSSSPPPPAPSPSPPPLVAAESLKQMVTTSTSVIGTRGNVRNRVDAQDISTDKYRAYRESEIVYVTTTTRLLPDICRLIGEYTRHLASFSPLRGWYTLRSGHSTTIMSIMNREFPKEDWMSAYSIERIDDRRLIGLVYYLTAGGPKSKLVVVDEQNRSLLANVDGEAHGGFSDGILNPSNNRYYVASRKTVYSFHTKNFQLKSEANLENTKSRGWPWLLQFSEDNLIVQLNLENDQEKRVTAFQQRDDGTLFTVSTMNSRVSYETSNLQHFCEYTKI